MPNGGLTPDCVHCKFYTGKPITEAEPHCQYHKINLPSPIRAFCKQYVDPEPADGKDWLDSVLDRNMLDESLMYLWLGGYEVTFFHVELVTIDDYSTWDFGKFMKQVRLLSDKYSD